jgi:hypothetical protein
MKGQGEKVAKAGPVYRAIFVNLSVESAAESTGMSYVTAWRWMKDPIVVEKPRATRRDAMNRAIIRRQEAASGAVDCLGQVQQEGESESARVSAARCIRVGNTECQLRLVASLGEFTRRSEALR